ncbi:hypothetical protein [Methylobacterium haplocladii]|uniref:Uncharacterized protein n=1 Tax=Methylobacterium haplocladii TaxID=1176176 RepID=A0A512ISD1_9HYPH|nr:hypothetical protein [Methylobacterium haplocladii]GEP00614.1 hypothetical protein MHA02_30010 [Methylobacterium haplocladii]GJD85528.1 hypothetical protein HPGCJGGD_3417 [Methylobacterium haplocladii]GLS57762.1 hypothetical protein GCM10007887_04180 [Methylobacterium haplocladii]
MAAVQRFLVQGATSLAEAVPVTTGGAANAGKIPALDPTTGTWDPTMMPPGVAADIKDMPASEALAGPCLVNVYANSGAATARNADGSTQGKPADGYVLGPVAANGTARVYLGSGVVPGFTGLTVGDAFLSPSTPGAVATAGAATAGQTWQKVGKVLDANTLQFTRGEPVSRN